MKLRLLSDVHLEFARNGPKYIKRFIPDHPCNDDILILAGDIGNPATKLYKAFLREISPYYAKVLIISGNHEYYQRYKRNCDYHLEITHQYKFSMDQIDIMIHKITSSFPNVHFLNRTSLIHNRIRFLGCTLWSVPDPSSYHYMNDFTMIEDMTPIEYNRLHEQDSTWLSSHLNESSDDYDKTIVITHHLPSYRLISDKFIGSPLNCFFANHLDHLVEKADIWVCGHSHSAKQINIGNCRCYLNPVGYPGENTSYDIDCIIDTKNSTENFDTKEELELSNIPYIDEEFEFIDELNNN